MKKLALIKDSDIYPGPAPAPESYRERTAARAVLFDKDNKIALLHVRKSGYYKLPGGGLDGDETLKQGLERELLEETGCHAEINGEIGEIEEYRNKEKIHQRSFVYQAKVVGKKGTINFMDDELEEDFHLEWMDLDEAIEKVGTSQPTTYEGPFIQKRDLIILKEVKNEKI